MEADSLAHADQAVAAGGRSAVAVGRPAPSSTTSISSVVGPVADAHRAPSSAPECLRVLVSASWMMR